MRWLKMSAMNSAFEDRSRPPGWSSNAAVPEPPSPLNPVQVVPATVVIAPVVEIEFLRAGRAIVADVEPVTGECEAGRTDA